MGRPQFLEEWIDGATICRESSAVGFVWSLYEGCLHFFAKLVSLVSKRPSTASANAVLNEEVGRLYSWGDGFENGGLDRVLERDPELKSTALEYLSSLGALLANKLLMVSTFTDVKGRSDLEAKADELRSLVYNAKTIIDESEDDESDLESETGARSSNKKAMLDEVASDIKFYNLRLMDLLPSIERTALQPKDAAESKNDSNSVASVPFQVSKPAHAYVLQVRDKFPKAENKLIERLGQANWERRKRLQEDQVDFFETAVSEPAKSVFVPVSMFHDSGLGSSIPAVSAYAPTEISHLSFRTSATESRVGSYRVPPTPKEVFDGKPFTCEICGHVLKKIKNRVDWKIHVFADLKPYICTSPSCLDELSTFPTRQMWADHEFRKHRVEKSWNCYLCPAHLSSLGLWDDHMKQTHETILSREEHQKAISMAEISKPMPIESQTCPLCLKVGMKTRKEFVTHVAKHMESISLAALPRDADSDSGSDFQLGSNSIEREDAVRTSRSSSLSLVNERFLTGDYEIEPYMIKCICGFSDDDGNTIFCEKCDTWQHIDCFYHGNVEEASRDDFNHLCADCKPRLLDRQNATERQRIRREEDKPVKIRDKKNTKRRQSISQKRNSDSDSEIESIKSRSTPDLPPQDDARLSPLGSDLNRQQDSENGQLLAAAPPAKTRDPDDTSPSALPQENRDEDTEDGSAADDESVEIEWNQDGDIHEDVQEGFVSYGKQKAYEETYRDDDVQSDQSEDNISKSPTKQSDVQTEHSDGKIAESLKKQSHVQSEHSEDKVARTRRKPPTQSAPRQSTFFINGGGIDREVITTDICRYMGNDALVKPGTHQDKSTGRIQEGFYITAYRPPTVAQLADLRADTAKWREERLRNYRSQGGYNESATRQEAMQSGNTDERLPGTYNYSPVGGNPPVPAGYGRAEPQGSYNPYGPRDPGVPPQEPQEDYYCNNEEIMDYEEPPAPAQAPAQAQPRQGQDRHQEPGQKRHGHH